MKLYDFDGMFDEKLSAYISKNAGKHRESEWEDLIPVLYDKFGDTPIKSIGKTPRQYYMDMDGDELIKCLKAHLRNGVPVSEFLCSAIEAKNLTEKLLPLLDGSEEEAGYAMSIIGADGRAIGKYLDMLVSSDSEEMKEKCADYIKEKADIVSDRAAEYYKNGVCPEYMLEIMSRTTVKSDEIFNILLKEFRTDPDNVSMHASYLASYGDERALEFLLDKIDEEGITFAEFQELKYAIEALGGEYSKKRDFTGDPYYDLIKGYAVPVKDAGDNSGNKN